jgi:zinc protease
VNLISFALACVAPRPDSLPEPLPTTPFSTWEASTARLSNGLEVLAFRAAGADVFYATVAVPHAPGIDPDGKGGASYLFTYAQGGRTDALGSSELTAALGQLGGYIVPTFEASALGLTVAGPAKHHEALLDLLMGVVAAHPLDDGALATNSELLSTYLRNSAQDPPTILADLLQTVAWGGVGPGRPFTESSVAAVTASDLDAWRARYWGPRGAVVLVEGPWTAEEIAPTLEAHLGAWDAPGSPPPPLSAVPVAAERLMAVHVPGAAQAAVGVVVVDPKLESADAACAPPTCGTMEAARIAGLVIGDQRVNHRLREVEGWTYAAWCTVEHHPAAALFSCTAAVQSDATALALDAMREEIDAAASRPPTDEEAERARRYLRDSTRTWDFSAYLRSGLQYWANGAPASAIQDRLDRLGAASGDGVRRAARALAQPERVWVVVGDLDAHREALRATGLPYEEVDRWGEPVVSP